ncbi:hypothetical protein B0A52_03831 [Exophiala mesophila]|uniref:Cytochrome b5 heme-binding domain-containing protein n=1 Tax=Exophiala mesophila TaxID=212818 RepID=A0A438N791_EXOME|nr:hypothetical protein B0A52_03831 [Exophiala mesophila]
MTHTPDTTANSASDFATCQKEEIPMKTADEVAVDHKELLWLVIDNEVYDCSNFAKKHPGGEAVIRRYAGSDCSVQFWRFHRREHLMVHGSALRIAKTQGVRMAPDSSDLPPPTMSFSNTTFEYDSEW